MSYRRDIGSYTVPFVIRNLKQNRWPTIVMRACILCSFTCISAAIFVLMHRLPREIALLLFIPVVLGIVVSFSIACFLLANRSIDKILLGDSLETRPRKTRWGIDDVQRIQIISILEEDYRERDSMNFEQVARIILRRSHGIRTISLLVSRADARRLGEWARHHEIQCSSGEIDV